MSEDPVFEIFTEEETGKVFAINDERIEVKDGKCAVVANVAGDKEAAMRYLQEKTKVYQKWMSSNWELK